MKNEENIKKGKLDSFVKKSFSIGLFLILIMFVFIGIQNLFSFLDGKILTEDEKEVIRAKGDIYRLEKELRNTEIKYKLNFFQDKEKSSNVLKEYFLFLPTDDIVKIDYSYVLEDNDISYSNFISSLELYINESEEDIVKDLLFQNNTLFLIIDELEIPIFYFDLDLVYIDKSIIRSTEYYDLNNIIYRFMVDGMNELNLTQDSLVNFISELESKGVIFPTICYKPVIYLYPKEKTNITVKLDNVNFTTTYPEYKENWSVIAYPDGTLIDKNDREYNYLYWEGYTKPFVDISEGFVVAKEDYIEFFETTLKRVGLTDKEACDFISYWLPYCNQFDYTLMSFQMENYEETVDLEFNIEPDNELRVYVAFKGLEEAVEIKEQDLSYYDKFERKGFTVVEWGGSIIE